VKKNHLGLWAASLGLGLTLLGAPAFAATPATAGATEQAAPADSKASPRPARELSTRQTGYAEREAASPRTAEFKGNGAGIYIGGSTLAVVLIIVLIVVLL
jgi:hypothetical protein